MTTADQYRAVSMGYARGDHKAPANPKQGVKPVLPRSNKWIKQRAAENAPTKAEKTMAILLREWLGPHGVEFYAQVPVLSYIADFYVPAKRLVIEVDGEYHFARSGRDAVRTKHLKWHGYQVIRFTNHEVMTDPMSMRNDVLRAAVGPHAVVQL